jgi:predicted metal-dependent enzyme (double-stranded beta helix superfamily)
MRIDLHIHSGDITQKLEIIMATLDDILNNEADEATQIAVIGNIVAALKQQVADALANTTIPSSVQTQIDAVFTQATANKAALATLAST